MLVTRVVCCQYFMVPAALCGHNSVIILCLTFAVKNNRTGH